MNKKDLKNYSQLEVEELIEENNLKTRWLSLIAHDFKGMFHNIVYLLNAYENKDIPLDLFLTMLPEIKQIAEKNLKTLETTFAWVNSQTDVFQLHLESINIYTLFLDFKKEFHDKIKSKNISLKFSGDNNSLIQSDKLLLTFILKQTIENAIKYSNKDGEVVFITGFQHDAVCIEIKDFGMGMNDKVLRSIFTLNGSPYKGSMDEVGAGLSLVVVKDFAKLLGAHMEVFSKLNEGTSVKFMF